MRAGSMLADHVSRVPRSHRPRLMPEGGSRERASTWLWTPYAQPLRAGASFAVRRGWRDPVGRANEGLRGARGREPRLRDRHRHRHGGRHASGRRRPVASGDRPRRHPRLRDQPGSDSISVIDTAADAVIATIPVGDGPSALAVTPDGERLYVMTAAGVVEVVDTALQTVAATIPVTVATSGPGGDERRHRDHAGRRARLRGGRPRPRHRHRHQHGRALLRGRSGTGPRPAPTTRPPSRSRRTGRAPTSASPPWSTASGGFRRQRRPRGHGLGVGRRARSSSARCRARSR